MLVEKHLNAEIQEGHHSSIIDARASLALFLKMRTIYGLEIDGPTFLTHNGGGVYKQRKGRKNRGYTTSQMIHRQAFKCLDNNGGETENQNPCSYERGPKPFSVAEPEDNDETLNPVEKELQNLFANLKSKIEKERIYKIKKSELK